MFKKIEELDVYRLSEGLADKVWDICVDWDAFAKHTVGRQFVNAADSIGANLSEGHGRYSLKENIQFCYYARGSLDETRNWIRRSFNRKLLKEKQPDELSQLLDERGPKLNAYINALKRKARDST
ncbi:MAG: four helix bundle protein [Ignavibacteriae bacterium]|nr:four helix bundle protein [Ignavibacteriota bacterium]